MEKLNNNEIKKILDLLDKGYSIRETADKSGHDKNTVLKYKKEKPNQKPTISSNKNDHELHSNSSVIQNDTWTSSAENITETPPFVHSLSSPSPLAPLQEETNEKSFRTRLDKIEDGYRQRENERFTDGIKQYKLLLNKQGEINQKKIRDKSVQQIHFEIEDLKEDYNFLNRLISRDSSKNEVKNDTYSNGENNQIFQTPQKEHIDTMQYMRIHDQQKDEPGSSIEMAKEKKDVRPSSHQAIKDSFTNDSENKGSSLKRSESTAEEEEQKNTTFSLSETVLLAGGVACAYSIVKTLYGANQLMRQQHQPVPQILIVPNKKKRKENPGSTQGK